MTYLLLCACFVAAAVAAAVLARRRGGVGHVRALAVTAVVLMALTAIFDNVMIAAGLFDYTSDRIWGVRIGHAPLEDFAYPLAGVLLLTAVWNLLDRERRP
jgi:small toxic polypeptide LdrA/B/C/D